MVFFTKLLVSLKRTFIGDKTKQNAFYINILKLTQILRIKAGKNIYKVKFCTISIFA